MEKDFQSAPKRFWQTIRRLRRGKRGSIQAVYSKGGTLLTSTEEMIGPWKEHFEELLNPTTPSMPYLRGSGVGQQVVLEGNRLVLTCLAGGSWPLQYRWSLNNSYISDWTPQYR
ncbi:hypothetical protein NHX12_017526 [Muraenolepis orangiensis]|uniref:Ig-like domain-containing protein n=1 Tax=Muraenolepis orangiensis TaxID=630683 RepID=A0A9Q0IXV3_9TELE|nr:hypothetical protein NHX12_017526 [Muraenolepis orangiensis]